jgi:hypothetical protein
MFSAIKCSLLILKRLINDITKNTLIKYNLSPPNSNVKLSSATSVINYINFVNTTSGKNITQPLDLI